MDQLYDIGLHPLPSSSYAPSAAVQPPPPHLPIEEEAVEHSPLGPAAEASSHSMEPRAPSATTPTPPPSSTAPPPQQLPVVAKGGGAGAGTAAGDLTQVVVNGFFSMLSCLFEPAKKEGDGEIIYEDLREISFIGSGSHGHVFLADYHGRTVAVKKLKELNMTLKEARHLRELKHENIIGFQGACLRPPHFCVVMEYCPRSLMEEIKQRPIPPELVLDWAAQVARGMDYLHKRHFIHRDLKSPNILISASDVLKISDFGTLREYGGHSQKLSFVGTVAWMAPETIRNEQCSEKVDVWSYGVVLWELLTGKVPYRGVEEAAIVYGVGSNRLHLPVPLGVPDGFSLLLKQCFNFTPKHRPVFRQILLHLEILASDTAFISQPHQTYFAAQADWGLQIARHFEELRQRKLDIPGEDVLRRLDEEMREAQRARQAYEEGIERASAMMRELEVLRDQMLSRSPSTSSNTSRRSETRAGRTVSAGRARRTPSSSSSAGRRTSSKHRSPGVSSARLASRVREGLRMRQFSLPDAAATDSMSGGEEEEEDGEREETDSQYEDCSSPHEA